MVTSMNTSDKTGIYDVLIISFKAKRKDIGVVIGYFNGWVGNLNV